MAPPTKKPSLAEITKNLPQAAAKTTQERVKGLGKSIVRTVHPKNLALRAAQIIHTGVTEELPEVGAAAGMVAGFGAEIYSRAQGKKQAGQSTASYRHQQLLGALQGGAAPAAPTSSSGMCDCAGITKLLETISATLKVISHNTTTISGELRTLSSLTAKVWDVNKKTLLATRQGNLQQLELERKRNFAAQEASDDEGRPGIGSFIFGKKGEGKDKEEAGMKKAAHGFAKSLEDKVVEGLTAGAGFKGLSSIAKRAQDKKLFKLLKKHRNERDMFDEMADRYEHVARNPPPGLNKVDKEAWFKDNMAKRTTAFDAAAKPAKVAGRLEKAISPAFLETQGAKGIAAGAEGLASIGSAALVPLTIAVVIGAVKGAMKSNLFRNFGNILDSVETTYKDKTLVDAIVDFFDKADVIDLIAQTVLGAGKSVADIGSAVGKSIVDNLVAIVQHMVHGILAAMGHLPKWMGGDKFKKWADSVDVSKDSWSKDIDAAAAKGAIKLGTTDADRNSMFEKASDALIEVDPTQPKTTLTPQPTDVTQNAANIDAQSQKYSTMRTAAQMSPLLNNNAPVAAPSIISAPTNNTSNTVNTFTNSGGRQGRLSSYINSNIDQ